MPLKKLLMWKSYVNSQERHYLLPFQVPSWLLGKWIGEAYLPLFSSSVSRQCISSHLVIFTGAGFHLAAL